MIHPAIQPFLPKFIALFKLHKITSAFLFGSVLTEKFSKESDINFLFKIENELGPFIAGGHLWYLIFELEDLLNRKVDLLPEMSLKNPYFTQELNNTKLAIYEVAC